MIQIQINILTTIAIFRAKQARPVIAAGHDGIVNVSSQGVCISNWHHQLPKFKGLLRKFSDGGFENGGRKGGRKGSLARRLDFQSAVMAGDGNLRHVSACLSSAPRQAAVIGS
ncbi:hypothetical protein V2G26_000311 [Clonostachys chloroleuca]